MIRRESAGGRAREPVGLPSRRAALAAIAAVEQDGAWSNLAVPEAVADLPEARDRAFASHLAYDTLRWRRTLDHALGQVLSRPLEQVEPRLQFVLRLGALQLLRTDIPVSAAVDTAAALAREAVPASRADGAAGFVNGVLRALARRREDLHWPDPAREPVAELALSTAHPEWIVRDLLARYGTERTRAILLADNEPPGLTLRVVGDRDALVAELQAAGIEATPGTTPAAIRAPGADPRRLSAVRDGRAVPQDEASMQVVAATGVQPGDRVLDLCAGPGGKTTDLARLVGPDGRVVAVELHPHRAELIRQAAHTQGVEVAVVVGDATDPAVLAEAARAAGVVDDAVVDDAVADDAVADDAVVDDAVADDGAGGFDVVLLDAPCTGLGTGRRRPEVRWRREPGDVRQLAAWQRRLLLAASGQLRAGGRLTYAVCTWTATETEAVVAMLDAARDDLELLHRVQLLPDVDDTDGMFHATWRRR